MSKQLIDTISEYIRSLSLTELDNVVVDHDATIKCLDLKTVRDVSRSKPVVLNNRWPGHNGAEDIVEPQNLVQVRRQDLLDALFKKLSVLRKAERAEAKAKPQKQPIKPAA